MPLGRGNIGQLGEEIARQHYVQSGFFIVAQNFFNRRGKQRGEIDFVARQKNALVFVEVKTRTYKPAAYQSAVEAITPAKHRKLRLAIRWFLAANPAYNRYRLRIDVCVVLLDKSAKYVKILSNAVEDLY
jgi:putative endonuclease